MIHFTEEQRHRLAELGEPVALFLGEMDHASALPSRSTAPDFLRKAVP